MTRWEKFFHTSFSFTAFLVVVWFGFWWFGSGHLPNNFQGWSHFFDIALFIMVSYIIWHPIVMEVLSWLVASHVKKPKRQLPQNGLRVAFITNFVPSSESIDLLIKTLPAMVATDYPHDTWLLDEGNNEQVKQLCDHWGVKYFTRFGKDYYNTSEGKFTRKTKGGNHNSWYDSFGNSYDIVAQIDTDFVPRRDFLVKTLGYFKDPKVAFVGTPQIYGNTGQSFVARGAAEQTYNFYGPMLRGFYGMDTTLLIGANHVIRVAALQDVDHYSAHITEDLLTGMKLHAKGWKSMYVDQPLAVGEGPTNWVDFLNQQMRWAFGCIDILFRHSPRLLPKMNFRQATYYFFLQQHYFSGTAMLLSVFGLALYFFLGINSANFGTIEFLIHYLTVITVTGLMALWLQRFNVRPKLERGLLFAGKMVTVAAWPTYFLALIGVIRRKRLSYKVTPKGDNRNYAGNRLKIFLFHLSLAAISIACLISSSLTGRQAPVLVAWAVISALTFTTVVVAQDVGVYCAELVDLLRKIRKQIRNQYRLFEFTTIDLDQMPKAPSAKEKYQYVKRDNFFLLGLSVVSFSAVFFSILNLFINNFIFWPLFGFYILSVVYFLISLVVNLGTIDFDLTAHRKLKNTWQPAIYPEVDVFLPTAGEPLTVLKNTWDGVNDIRRFYLGRVNIYCLDDSARTSVRRLAEDYNFIYESRPNRGEFKKAGNLRHGYKVSSGEFIAIFDADFKPRKDFLNELLPYFYRREKIGIVQSPQYFDVHEEQNWLERGAGAVQELFYRLSQVSRQSHDASICVGSNAIYRRRALDDIGGTALIEHSEDVHTGFNLRMQGWTIEYLPIILAKGLCPSNMTAFFKQQYRWCMGSMSLLKSKKFWQTKLGWRGRMSYFSGFLYYIHTALSVIFLPVIPIILLIFLPQHILIQNYLLILPSIIFTQIVYPLWHHKTYGVEAWSTRLIYGWAHLFAIFDTGTNKVMAWQPTGIKMKRDHRYIVFRIMQIFLNLIPALVWAGLTMYRGYLGRWLDFLPMFLSSLYYLAICAKVAFYKEYKSDEIDKSITILRIKSNQPSGDKQKLLEAV